MVDYTIDAQVCSRMAAGTWQCVKSKTAGSQEPYATAVRARTVAVVQHSTTVRYGCTASYAKSTCSLSECDVGRIGGELKQSAADRRLLLTDP